MKTIHSGTEPVNILVPGYRRDISVQPTDSVFLDLDGSMDSRAFAVREDRNKFDGTPGAIDHTNNDMDIAIRSEGYMYGTVGDDPFLTRRGDLSMASEGLLTNGAGQQILDTELNPLQFRPTARSRLPRMAGCSSPRSVPKMMLNSWSGQLV